MLFKARFQLMVLHPLTRCFNPVGKGRICEKRYFTRKGTFQICEVTDVAASHDAILRTEIVVFAFPFKGIVPLLVQFRVGVCLSRPRVVQKVSWSMTIAVMLQSTSYTPLERFQALIQLSVNSSSTTVAFGGGADFSVYMRIKWNWPRFQNHNPAHMCPRITHRSSTANYAHLACAI